MTINLRVNFRACPALLLTAATNAFVYGNEDILKPQRKQETNNSLQRQTTIEHPGEIMILGIQTPSHYNSPNVSHSTEDFKLPHL